MTSLRKNTIKNKIKIGLFGGTFNPIHYGHLKMAEAARKSFKLSIVYFIPNGNPPHRKTDLLPGKKRYDLVKKAIKGKKYFEALDLEIRKKTPSYTIDTVKKLQLLKPSRHQVLFFLIGQDAFEKLDTWRKADELVKFVEFIVFPRELKHTHKIPKIKNLKYHLLKVKPINISGSEVRKKMKKIN